MKNPGFLKVCNWFQKNFYELYQINYDDSEKQSFTIKWFPSKIYIKDDLDVFEHVHFFFFFNRECSYPLPHEDVMDHCASTKHDAKAYENRRNDCRRRMKLDECIQYHTWKHC